MNKAKIVFFSVHTNQEACLLLSMLEELECNTITLRSAQDSRRLNEYECKIAIFDQFFVRMFKKLWRQRSITGNKIPRWVTEYATHSVAIECGRLSGSFSEKETAASEIYLWALNHHFTLPENAVTNVTHLPRRDRMNRHQQQGGVDLQSSGRAIFRHLNRNRHHGKKRR